MGYSEQDEATRAREERMGGVCCLHSKAQHSSGSGHRHVCAYQDWGDGRRTCLVGMSSGLKTTLKRLGSTLCRVVSLG